MGYIDEDGYIYITGRIKEMINRGGEKISPYEVEKAILSHPEISDAAVFPYPNRYGSENAGAVIVTGNDEIDLAVLRRFLHEKVSPYKMPTKLYIVDEIPKSKNNKVQRKMLYEQLKEIYPETDSASEKPEKETLNKTQRSVKRIWRKALYRKNIRLDDNFHEIGGDSLNGMLILSEIEKKFNMKVPTEILFNDGTINKVCSYLDSQTSKWNNYRFLTPIKATGSKKPLICLHSPMGDAVTYNHLGNYMEEDRPIIGISFSRLKGDWEHPVSFEQMAGRYIEEITQYDPEGPYFICGFCYGGVLAFKVASMMKEAGYDVAMLVMMDSASKAVTRNKPRVRYNIFQEIKIRIGETIKQLKPYPPIKRIGMVFYKVKRFIIYIYGFYTTKLYWIASKHNIKPLIAVSRGNGALSYAYNKYKPKHYDGKIHYIKATERKKPNENEKYWAQFTDDFELFKMKSDHNGIIKGENARILVQYLTDIMEDLDA
jgi:thioesterase domain-containing protein/acyl carrier protein